MLNKRNQTHKNTFLYGFYIKEPEMGKAQL